MTLEYIFKFKNQHTGGKPWQLQIAPCFVDSTWLLLSHPPTHPVAPDWPVHAVTLLSDSQIFTFTTGILTSGKQANDFMITANTNINTPD